LCSRESASSSLIVIYAKGGIIKKQTPNAH
jgi:hypothetical protein